MKRNSSCFGFLMVAAIASVGPALGQADKTTPAFYVVLNSLTKGCVVVDRTPKADTPNITVASDAVYKTRAEAETAMKTLPSCNR
jgi:hypothetical protein